MFMKTRVITLSSILMMALSGARAQTTVTVTPVQGQTNQWQLTMPAGNVQLNVNYKTPTTLTLTYGGAAITAGGVNTYLGDEALFLDSLAAVVTDNSSQAVASPTFTVTSSNPSVVAFGTEGTASGALADIRFLATGTATLTILFDGTDDYATSTATLALTVGEHTYTVTIDDGGIDTAHWAISPATAVTTGVTAGTQVQATYSGTRKVKSVRAVKKGPAVTTLDNNTTAWTAGTFAVPAGGLTYSDAITVSGDVTLTLTDGETLTLNSGLSLASGATLTVEGTGTMNVNGTNGADNNSNDMEASGGSGTAAISGSGTLVLTSGTVTAIGGKGGNVSDYGVECKGGHGAAAISCTLTVNGGTLTATGGNGGSLTNGFGPEGVAGNGGAGISGALTVNGGTLTATGSNRGAKSSGPGASDGNIGRGVSSTWTAGTGITFSDSANGTSWTANTGTSSTQRYVKAE